MAPQVPRLPGHMVVFFSALDVLAANSIGIPAGFSHLPLESELPTPAAVSAIAEAIRLAVIRK